MRQADDTPREYSIDDWTSIFINGKIISKASLNFDDGSGPKTSNAGFWLGTIHDFQGKGTFRITISSAKNSRRLNAIYLDQVNMNWKIIDRIDANSFMEYRWENGIGRGILEGFTDLIGDKMFGMSYDVNVLFYDCTSITDSLFLDDFK